MKIISCEYDEKTGRTVAKLGTELGIFIGQSFFNKEKDPLRPSRLIGGQLAENNAYQRYYQQILKNQKQELKGLNRLLAAMPDNIQGKKYAKNLYNTIKTEINETEWTLIELKERRNQIIKGRSIYIRSRTIDKKERAQMLQSLGDSLASLSNINKDKD